MTDAFRLLKKRTVLSAAGLAMFCCASLMVVFPMLHRLHFSGAAVALPLCGLELVGLAFVVKSFMEVVRLRWQGGNA